MLVKIKTENERKLEQTIKVEKQMIKIKDSIEKMFEEANLNTGEFKTDDYIKKMKNELIENVGKRIHCIKGLKEQLSAEVKADKIPEIRRIPGYVDRLGNINAYNMNNNPLIDLLIEKREELNYKKNIMEGF